MLSFFLLDESQKSAPNTSTAAAAAAATTTKENKKPERSFWSFASRPFFGRSKHSSAEAEWDDVSTQSKLCCD